jgi:soluble lytic murein transglycosylase
MGLFSGLMAGLASGAKAAVRPGAMPPPEPWRARLPAMIQATLEKESGGQDSDAQGRAITSRKGAEGRMQVMPGTNSDPGYGVKAARDGSLEERARVGRDYLEAMMRRYDGDPAKAWAAYNMGPIQLNRLLTLRGDRWRAHLPAETADYLDTNLARLDALEAEARRPHGMPGYQFVPGGWIK